MAAGPLRLLIIAKWSSTRSYSPKTSLITSTHQRRRASPDQSSWLADALLKLKLLLCLPDSQILHKSLLQQPKICNSLDLCSYQLLHGSSKNRCSVLTDRDSRRFSIEKYWELCAKINSPHITEDVVYLQTKGFFVFNTLLFWTVLKVFKNSSLPFTLQTAVFCKESVIWGRFQSRLIAQHTVMDLHLKDSTSVEGKDTIGTSQHLIFQSLVLIYRLDIPKIDCQLCGICAAMFCLYNM